MPQSLGLHNSNNNNNNNNNNSINSNKDNKNNNNDNYYYYYYYNAFVISLIKNHVIFYQIEKPSNNNVS